MNNKILIIFCGIFLLSMISAAGPFIKLTINGNNLTAQGFLMYEGFGQYPAPIITNFQDVIVSSNCTFNNVTNATTCSNYNYTYTRDIPIMYNYSNSVTMMTDSCQEQLTQCLSDKAAFNAGLNSCVDAKNENVLYKDNYTRCGAELIVCQGDMNRCSGEKKTAEDNYNDIVNAKWIFLVIGIIAGIVMTLIYRRELFGPKVKTAEDNFNRQQAG